MNIRSFFTFAMSSIILSISATGQFAYAAEPLNCGNVYGPDDNGTLQRFDEEFRSALSSDDVSQLSLLISFPLRVNQSRGGTTYISGPKALQASYAMIFPDAISNSVLSTSFEGVRCMSSGVMYANGTVWIEPTAIEGKLTYRIGTINLPDSSALSLKDGERLLEFVCETASQRILVDSVSGSSFRLRVWNKPNLISATPDIDIHSSINAHFVEGTGVCSHNLWKFDDAGTSYTIAELGCTDSSVPSGAQGTLKTIISGSESPTMWCQ